MRSNDVGVTEQTITPLRDSERLKGTEYVWLRYLDGRVASIPLFAGKAQRSSPRSSRINFVFRPKDGVRTAYRCD